MNIRFHNTAGVPFVLHSSLKPEGYLVTGQMLELHYVIKNSQVTTQVANDDSERQMQLPVRTRMILPTKTIS